MPVPWCQLSSAPAPVLSSSSRALCSQHRCLPGDQGHRSGSESSTARPSAVLSPHQDPCSGREEAGTQQPAPLRWFLWTPVMQLGWGGVVQTQRCQLVEELPHSHWDGDSSTPHSHDRYRGKRQVLGAPHHTHIDNRGAEGSSGVWPSSAGTEEGDCCTCCPQQ